MRGFSRILAVAFCGLSLNVGWAQVASQPASTVPVDEAGRVAAARQLRKVKVAALVADAKKLYDATQFREAMDLLRQAVIIDPEDENAALFLRIVTEKITVLDYERIQSRFTGPMPLAPLPRDLVVDSPRPAREAVAFYPPITITGARIDEMEHEPPASAAARDRLEENLKEITAEGQGFEKVINFLRDNMGANIFVNWTALAELGVDRNTPISLALKEVPFRKALTTVLSQAAGGAGKIVYQIDDGIITISTKADFTSSNYQTVKVYDIRDLVHLPLNNVEAPRISSFVRDGDLGNGRGGFGNGGGGFGNGDGAPIGDHPATRPAPGPAEESVRGLIDVIQRSVAPETWKDHGGTIGSIRELNGQLIVNQLVDNHKAILDFLNALRDSRDGHVKLEARLVLVPASFFDSVPIGWTSQSDPLLAAATGPASDAVDGKFKASVLDDAALARLLRGVLAAEPTATLTASVSKVTDNSEATLACVAPMRFVAGYARKLSAEAFSPVYARVDTGVNVAFKPILSPDAKSLMAQITLTRTTIGRVDQKVAADLPDGVRLEIEEPILSRAAGTFGLTLPDSGTALINLGPVPADYLRTVSTHAEGGAKAGMQMMLLLRTTIVPRDRAEFDRLTKPSSTHMP